MSYFYGRLRGSRGEATRCGSRSSGLRVSANSWNFGLSSSLRVFERSGELVEVLDVYLTTGSGGTSRFLFSVEVSVNGDKVVRYSDFRSLPDVLSELGFKDLKVED